MRQSKGACLASSVTMESAIPLSELFNLSRPENPLAGHRFVLSVGVPLSLIPGRWNSCAERALNHFGCCHLGIFPFLKADDAGEHNLVEMLLRQALRERRLWFEQAHIMSSDSVFSMGTALLVAHLRPHETDNIAFSYSMPIHGYLRRGHPLQLIWTA